MTRSLLPPLLILLLGLVLAAFLLQPLVQLPQAARLHLVFAAAVLPLILGSITWFVPVLTRSGPPPATALGPPLLAVAGGLLLLHALTRDLRLFPLAALLDLAAVTWLWWWIGKRAAAALGGPHPGLLWYRLALGALLLGLAAILLGALWPAQWPQLRRLHLHLNLLGFIGLTALGTWRVLLPTAGGFTDAAAGPWLQRQWRPLAAGTLAIATGAAWWPPLSLAGLLLWLWPVAGLLRDPLLSHRDRVLRWHGAAPALATAIGGLALLLLAAGVHAPGRIPGSAMAAAFIALFLLPLVTGAATHLLPLWRFPGDADSRRRLQHRLGRLGGLRGLLFLAAGLALLAGTPWGWLPLLAGLGHFIALLVTGRPASQAG